MIFQTQRLMIRKATTSDIDMYLSLWNNEKVMKLVGWKYGLQITAEEIEKLILSFDETEFNQTLVVVEKASGKRIGECKLGLPSKDGIAFTDIKLLPEYWGNGYGVEIKNALCHYLFRHTDAEVVKADPNIKNIASRKMQMACGGVEVERGVWHVSPERKHICVDVPFIVYHIYRDAWLEKNMKIKKIKKKSEKLRVLRIPAIPKNRPPKSTTKKLTSKVFQILIFTLPICLKRKLASSRSFLISRKPVRSTFVVFFPIFTGWESAGNCCRQPKTI